MHKQIQRLPGEIDHIRTSRATAVGFHFLRRYGPFGIHKIDLILSDVNDGIFSDQRQHDDLERDFERMRGLRAFNADADATLLFTCSQWLRSISGVISLNSFLPNFGATSRLIMPCIMQRVLSL
ncbi:hypothetical protein DDT52_11015 [Brenneria roseae subsp. roseae]|uniref:hypothetical protein n=1 Tax=Brenneria roseae TaxID=1509241 RepID=UPI000D606A73|nr:hypothetical protein [Brenneria roseae]PWC19878.1 hypothetical protein DDT52_11015 [Brenneria roseae subsp. roseae]